MGVFPVVRRPSPQRFVEHSRQQLLENGAVDVLGQLVQQEPGADVGLVDDLEDLVVGGAARMPLQQQKAERRNGDRGQAVGQGDGADRGEGDEPKRQDGEDLAVDDVQRQHAQAVDRLHAAGRTAVFEPALGGRGEDPGRRIGYAAAVRILTAAAAAVPDRVNPVRQELTLQKTVQEQYLGDDVDQVQRLARRVLEDVRVVPAVVLQEVARQFPETVGNAVVVRDHHSQVLGQRLDPAAFPRLPHVPSKIKVRD